MDYQFPHQLFPGFYNCGPPDVDLKVDPERWGSYNGVIPQGNVGPRSSWSFTPRHHIRGETWCHTEPVPMPLLSPKRAFLGPLTPPDPQDFTEHMQNFFTDHSQDAFGGMSGVLGENFHFRPKNRKESRRKDAVSVRGMKSGPDILKHKVCHQTYQFNLLKKYSGLMSDVIHDIPPELLGSLLYEELAGQRDRMLFFENATGGALVFVPFSQSSSISSSQRGCLLYPAGQGLDRLNFHEVEMHYQGVSPGLDARSSKPISFQLQAPVRQISYASNSQDSCVAVRADHFCGVWRFSEGNEPRLLQVINTEEVATCINVSPHVMGEVLVANESTVASLWTVGQGMQKVRVEDSNLYFNAQSSWRWCEFSAHPRVMLYADRTGVELTDMRESPACSHTLFRISRSSECRSSERLVLSKYLGQVHPFHHLITTQCSAYVVDERFPCVPMLKWDHMMESPPVFCHAIPDSAAFVSVGGESSTTKLLLSSYSSQEITMLQYSGGRAQACLGRGPPQALLRPREALKHLPVQIPHRLHAVSRRMSSPAAGLTCIDGTARRGSMCVLQLTEAGDIFYQVLEHKLADGSTPRSPAGGSPPERAAEDPSPPALGSEGAERLPGESQTVIPDTPVKDTGGPTRGMAACTAVAETPEREQPTRTTLNFDHEGRLRDQLIQMDLGNDDGNVAEVDPAGNAKKHSDEEAVNITDGPAPVTLSAGSLATWKQWLQKQNHCGKKSRPQSSQHFRIRTTGLLSLSNTGARDACEKGHTESLRTHMRSCMSSRSLLVHSTVSASLGVLDVVPMPSVVDTDAWSDPLSQRLTLSWQGEGLCQAWWEEELGTNREAKMEALRRKRRQAKEARRAAGHRLKLSRSFDSSANYQSERDDFSSIGWSSPASRDVWSDREGCGPLSELATFLEETQRDPTPSSSHTVPTSTASPKRVGDKVSGHHTPGGTGTPTKSPRAAETCRKATRRPAEDSLDTLIPTQDDLSQKDFLEKEDERDRLRIPAAGSSSQPHGSSSQPHGSSSQPHSSFSQPHGSSSQPHGSFSQPHGSFSQPHGSFSQPHGSSSQPHGSFSQPHGSFSQPHGSSSQPHGSFSQPHGSLLLPSRVSRLTSSQGSQGLPGRSQGSQPKKKTRMGF
ncbi:TATA box-binding protein-associated factor RNA polymerase I subunit C [Cololabis saira]|uniref:TATA box-binding protein-associated factor RNA polymerase I subunit C n=1 Tax=Cololabis saira TaxID=129043 RepID=UPI002AD3379C|nr:TATA box-binding protein-associated factor RNA polymerase I subunit C [Cololabis saira]